MTREINHHISVLILYTSVIRKDHLVKELGDMYPVVRAIPLRSFSANYHPENYSVIIIEHDFLKQSVQYIRDVLIELEAVHRSQVKIILSNVDTPDPITKYYQAGADLCMSVLTNYIPHLIGFISHSTEENAISHNEEKEKLPILFMPDTPHSKTLKTMCDKLAKNKIPVLIVGPTGTGKNAIAEYIHFKGKGRPEKFISVDCATLNENLFESEMFGHVKGAFTGAVMDQSGKLELAHGGTLLLDGIENLSAKLQAKLAAVLDSREFSPVGSDRKIQSEFRLISIINKPNIEDLSIIPGLMFRINGVSIQLPPLRENRDAIPFFFSHFAKKYGMRLDENTLNEIHRKLLEYSWPGNLKEMNNLIEKLSLLSDTITPEYLHLHFNFSAQSGTPLLPGVIQPLKDIVSSYVRFAHRENKFNITKTAEALGISRTTVAKYVKEG